MNRHGLVVDATVTTATGTAEREAAVEMITGVLPAEPDVADAPRITLGADKGIASQDVV